MKTMTIQQQQRDVPDLVREAMQPAARIEGRAAGYNRWFRDTLDHHVSEVRDALRIRDEVREHDGFTDAYHAAASAYARARDRYGWHVGLLDDAWHAQFDDGGDDGGAGPAAGPADMLEQAAQEIAEMQHQYHYEGADIESTYLMVDGQWRNLEEAEEWLEQLEDNGPALRGHTSWSDELEDQHLEARAAGYVVQANPLQQQQAAPADWHDESPEALGAGGGCPSCGYSIHDHAPHCTTGEARAQRVAREHPDGGVYGLRIGGLRNPTEIAVVEAAVEFALRQHRAKVAEQAGPPFDADEWERKEREQVEQAARDGGDGATER